MISGCRFSDFLDRSFVNIMNLKTSIISISLGCFGSSFVINSSQAAILNGDFNNGLQNWQTIGDVSVQTDFSSGNLSNPQALLTTASSLLQDDGIPAGAFNFSGNDPASAQFPGFNLQSFLGLGSTNLNSGFLPATEGSAIKQVFAAKENDVLSFEFNFLTNDASFFGSPRDFATIALQDNSSGVISTISLAQSTGNLSNSSTIFQQETGWRTYRSGQLKAGNYTLGFGVIDVFGTDKTSALLIDNVLLSSETTTPIPEPTSLMLGALMALGVGSRLKKKAKSNRG